jgi:hypothetical protein
MALFGVGVAVATREHKPPEWSMVVHEWPVLEHSASACFAVVSFRRAIEPCYGLIL